MTGRAEALNNIGVIHLKQRNYNTALNFLGEAQKAFEAVGDAGRQAQSLGNLGDVFAAQGRYKEAGGAYSDAAQLFAQIKDASKQADVLRAYALLAVRRRDFVTAIHLLAQSLRVQPRRSFGQQLFYLLLRTVLKLMAGR